MAEFPIACNVQGDYGYKIIVVNEDEKIADIVKRAADQVVGYLIPPFPEGTTLNARIHGSEECLLQDSTVKEAQLSRMEVLDISART